MNLIHDKWITVRRADGTGDTIAPWEIGESQNPVIEIVAPRPDFRGALYQFLIGLVQTTFAPEDDDEWEDRWEKTPRCEELKVAFERHAEAFEVFNEKGPAFMQDFSLLADLDSIDIRSLLIDSPGQMTTKQNKAHFVKGDKVAKMCTTCAITSIYTLQVNAPSGGQGHRTSMRGGGPLTTLVLPQNHQESLWNKVWYNVLSCEEMDWSVPLKAEPDIYPWLTATRVSVDDFQTPPEAVSPLQMYWGMPRRVRLCVSSEQGQCNVCDKHGGIHTHFRMQNYGVSYSSTWVHTLSPYRRRKTMAEGKDEMILFAVKGKQGGLCYQDWLPLAIGLPDVSTTKEKNGVRIVVTESELAAMVVRSFNERKIHRTGRNSLPSIWCFGYDMDNMKARCWYEHTLPLVEPGRNQNALVSEVVLLVAAADAVADVLRDQIRAAWSNRPKDMKGDTSYLSKAFWESTEASFYTQLTRIQSALTSNQSTAGIRAEWRRIVLNSAHTLFDHFALQETDDPRNMQRIAVAARTLTTILNSKKTKPIQALLQ